MVSQDGLPTHRLRHVPIFAYGFGLAGLAAFDTALAILADTFGETLSLTEFANGHHRCCSLYQAFAKEVICNPRSQGRFETAQIATFLRREYRKKQREAGNGGSGGVEKDTKELSGSMGMKGKRNANTEATERSV